MIAPEAPKIRKARARHYMALAELAASKWHTLDESFWTAQLTSEIEHLRATLEICISERLTHTALRMLSALAPYWISRGLLPEGKDWAARILAIEHANASPHFAAAQAATGKIMFWLGKHDESLSMFEKALVAAELKARPFVVTTCRAWMAGVHFRYGRQDLATQLAQEALESARLLGQPSDEALSLLVLGGVHFERENMVEARESLKNCLGIFSIQGDYRRRVLALNFLGLLEHHENQPQLGYQSICEAIALCQAAGDFANLGYSLSNLGLILAALGDLDQAAEKLSEGQQILHTISATDWEARNRAFSVEVALQSNDLPAAITHLHESLVLTHRAQSARRKLLAIACTARWLCANGDYARAISMASYVIKHHKSGSEANRPARIALCEATPHIQSADIDAPDKYSGKTLDALFADVMEEICQDTRRLLS